MTESDSPSTEHHVSAGSPAAGPDEHHPAVPTRTPVSEDERLARAALCRAVGPDENRAHAAVRKHGPVAVWNVLRARHPDVDPEADLRAQQLLGGRFICPGDAEWPVCLDALDAPGAAPTATAVGAPFGLWVLGSATLAALAERAVALVGARAATPYGTHMAHELAVGLAEAGWTVVSGAAFGIDAAAHRGALAGAGPTVAVLAGGCDLPYPRAHTDLLAEIASSGAVVSEAPPGTPHFRRRFLTRNRITAGLAQATVIVEAGPRSGSASTARQSRLLGRPVGVVPGPVTSAFSAGCHQLLRAHPATTVLVTSAADIIADLNQPHGDDPHPAGPDSALPTSTD